MCVCVCSMRSSSEAEWGRGMGWWWEEEVAEEDLGMMMLVRGVVRVVGRGRRLVVVTGGDGGDRGWPVAGGRDVSRGCV